MAAIGSIFGVLGSLVSAAGTVAAGRAQKEAADMEAAQLEAEGKEREAMAAVEAAEERKQKEQALSSLQARAAGSGFSATDPTALMLAADIEEYGTYRQQLARYGGASERNKLDYKADITRRRGEAALKAAKSQAFGTIIGGFGSIAKGFGGGGSTIAPTGRYG